MTISAKTSAQRGQHQTLPGDSDPGSGLALLLARSVL